MFLAADYQRLEVVEFLLDQSQTIDINMTDAIDTQPAIRYFEASLKGLRVFLSRGAILPRTFSADVVEAELANDGQNVHTSFINRKLFAAVQEAQTTLGNDSTNENNTNSSQETITFEELKTVITELTPTALNRIVANAAGNVKSHIAGRSDAEKKRSLIQSADRVMNNLNGIQGSVMQSGSEAVSLVVNRLKKRFIGSSKYDFENDIIVPLMEVLLAAQHWYSWNGTRCAPGTISDIIMLLVGRTNVDENTDENPAIPDSFHNYLLFLEKLKDADQDALLVEAQQKILENKNIWNVFRAFLLCQNFADDYQLFFFTPKSAVNNHWIFLHQYIMRFPSHISVLILIICQEQKTKIQVEHIYEMRVDGNEKIAKNRLRGLFFQALSTEHEALLLKYKVVDGNHNPTDMVQPSMQTLLHDVLFLMICFFGFLHFFNPFKIYWSCFDKNKVNYLMI